MSSILTIIWALSQVISFGLSVWFVIFGIRTWNQQKKTAVLLFGFGFFGMYQVVEALWAIGILR